MINTLSEVRCQLGESPIWHELTHSLFFVDIHAKALHKHNVVSGIHQRWQMPEHVSAVVPTAHANVVAVALEGRIAFFDWTESKIVHEIALPHEPVGNRCNDAKADPAGRLFVGTIDIAVARNSGSLYCIDTNGKPRIVLTSLPIANGIEWIGSDMLFAESKSRCVFRFDAQLAIEGIASLVDIAADTTGSEMPDGICLDAENKLWVACWGTGKVKRFDLDTKKVIAEIVVPAPHVTSCAFGGADLSKLYVTTATDGMTDTQLKRFPLSGSVFVIETGVRGKMPNVLAWPR